MCRAEHISAAIWGWVRRGGEAAFSAGRRQCEMPGYEGQTPVMIVVRRVKGTRRSTADMEGCQPRTWIALGLKPLLLISKRGHGDVVRML